MALKGIKQDHCILKIKPYRCIKIHKSITKQYTQSFSGNKELIRKKSPVIYLNVKIYKLMKKAFITHKIN